MEQKPDHENDGGAQEEVELAFYGSVSGLIVGIQHYRGDIHVGEMANLVREPSNPYDRNALRVDNLAGVQIGHIKKETAAALAPVLDNASHQEVNVCCDIIRQNSWNCDCKISVWGVPSHDAAQAIGALLRSRGVHLHGGLAAAPQAPASMPSVQSQQVVVRLNSQEDLDALFEKLSDEETCGLDLEAARQAVFNQGVVTSELFHHQLVGVAWMMNRELSSMVPPYYTEVTEQKRKAWVCRITNSSASVRPENPRGGMLLDEMGLGKTLQVLALVVANPPAGARRVGGVRAIADGSADGSAGGEGVGVKVGGEVKVEEEAVAEEARQEVEEGHVDRRCDCRCCCCHC
jgi:SWI/SNF-related matrix-associated actin-dependent regulator of chromatin subfamily A3